MKNIFILLFSTVLILTGCSGSTEPETGDNAPSNLEAEYYWNSEESSWAVDLSWDAPSEPDNDNFQYRIYKDNEHIATNDAMLNYYTDMDCVIGGEYSYYVTAYYISGESDHSNTVNVIIDTEPNPPSNPFPANN